MKKKTLKLPNGSKITFGEIKDPFEGLEEIVDNGVDILEVPKDFILDNGKLNPKYRNTYPLLKNKAN